MWLCSNDIGPLRVYLASLKRYHNDIGRGKYVVCGKLRHWKCTLCPNQPKMRLKEDKSANKLGYALDWHKDDYFGFCVLDEVIHLLQRDAQEIQKAKHRQR